MYDIMRIDPETRVIGREGAGRAIIDQAIFAEAKKRLQSVKKKCGIHFMRKCGKGREYILNNPPLNVDANA